MQEKTDVIITTDHSRQTLTRKKYLGDLPMTVQINFIKKRLIKTPTLLTQPWSERTDMPEHQSSARWKQPRAKHTPKNTFC